MAFSTVQIEERVRGIAERVASSEGLELVDAEWKGGSRGGVLRVYVDKPAGVTHTDCETVSRRLSAILDVEDFFPESYNLEVSSPGLDRKLLKPADYERFAGRKAKIQWRDPLEGRKQVTGRLTGINEGKVLIESAQGARREFAFEEIEQARLVVEI